MKPGQPRTGRETPRGRRGICLSCRMRYAIGEPQATDSWPAQLHINSTQMDLLLIAAKEFDQLCEESGEYATAVGFVDWVRIDALSPGFGTSIDVQAVRERMLEKSA